MLERAYAMMRTVVVLAIALSASSAYAQTQYVAIEPTVRLVLANDWDAHAGNPEAPERAWCLDYITVSKPGAEMHMVMGTTRARTLFATPKRITYQCPPNTIPLHTHQPVTCVTGETDCFLGGIEAYSCEPSQVDIESQARTRHPIHIVQCDRNAFVPFYLRPNRPRVGPQ